MAEVSGSIQNPLCSEADNLIQKVLRAPEPERSDAWKELVKNYITPIARRVAKRRGLKGEIRHIGSEEVYEEPSSLRKKRKDLSKEDDIATEERSLLQNRQTQSSRVFEEFCKGYKTYVWQRLRQYDPSKSTSKEGFFGWCFRVLDNWLIDLSRSETARRKKEVLATDLYNPEETETGLEETAEDRRVRAVWQIVAEKECLTAAQIALLRGLPVLRRVIACAAAGLAWRIPSETWRKWVEDAELEPEFPPQTLADYDEPLDRLRVLAEYLQTPLSTLRAHWYRSRKVLQDLMRQGDDG